jgi:serine/threonine-protein kinase
LELRTGTRIDRYELIAPIATGGMGSVWLARVRRSADFERFFAVKTVLPQYAADPGFRKMFMDETRIASAISHANVASILDVGEQDGTLYMIMEYVEGDSLNVLMMEREGNGQKVEPRVALRIVADACAGLHAVHEARDRAGKPLEIVHRDLSPHNILISTHGQPKLVDFGVARARDRLADTTSSGTLKGKVRYMSPEYAAGESIDRRSDLWGIGAVLYRLLEGRCPVDADNNYAVLRMLLNKDPPEPMSPAVPAPLAAVVMRCLELDPANRYSTAEEVHRALEKAMVDLGLTATVPDVAAYSGEHLRDISDRKKKTIEATLAELERADGALPDTPGPLSDPRGGVSSISLMSVEGVPLGSDMNEPATKDVTVLLETSRKARALRRAQRLQWVLGAVAVAGAVVAATAFAGRGSPKVAAATPASATAVTAQAPPEGPAPLPPPTAIAEAPSSTAPEADSAKPAPQPVPAVSVKGKQHKAASPQPTSVAPRTRVSSAPSDVFDDRK